MWFAAWIGCNAPPRAVDVVEGEAVVETVAPAASAHAGAGPAVVYAAPEGGWTWADPRGDTVVPFVQGVPRAAAEARGNRFVLAEAVQVLQRDDALPVGSSALGGRELLDLCGDGDLLWVTVADGVVVWRGDVLADLVVDEAPPAGPVACGGALAGERVAWVADGTRVHALGARNEVFDLLETHDLGAPIDGLAVDGEGHAWVAAGGRLHRRSAGAWSRLRLPSEVSGVLGGQRSQGVWALTEEGPAFVPSGIAAPTAVRPSSAPGFATSRQGSWATDDLGRLLVRDADGLHRVSVDRPLWVEGLEGIDVLGEVVTLRLLPTSAAEATLRVLVGATEVPVGADGLAVLDAAELPAGEQPVRAVASYPDGAITLVERTVIVAPAGGITWTDHIGPIHERSCVLCHASTTETILDGPGAWEDQIGPILEQVESGAMPLGRPDLSPEQIALIEAWADGGFLP